MEGIVTIVGESPKRKLIDMGQDLVCTHLNDRPTLQDVIVNEGRLANVWSKSEMFEADRHPSSPKLQLPQLFEAASETDNNYCKFTLF